MLCPCNGHAVAHGVCGWWSKKESRRNAVVSPQAGAALTYGRTLSLAGGWWEKHRGGADARAVGALQSLGRARRPCGIGCETSGMPLPLINLPVYSGSLRP